MHKKYGAHASPDRCKKCGDSQHVEGFRCPVSKYQCKNCHKFGHFSSLCYKKKEFEHKSDKSSSDDSFCLQVKLKSTQAENPVPQHLITNLAYKLNPHKKTQYLSARLGICSDVNIMPVSVYHLILKDADCMKLAPSSKLEIETYTGDKIKVIGSCTLLAVHPDTQCLKEVTFHVTSHEGSVVLSCATTLDLCLIWPHSNLDSIPSSDSLITGTANYLRKKKSQKNMLVSKPKKNVCSSKEQSHLLSRSEEYQVNHFVIQEDKEERNKWECKANVIYREDDKNNQSTMCSDKNCQETKFTQMWPVKPSYMQLAKTSNFTI